MSESRADLHVHSRYSDRPSEWFLRRIGAPESFVDPREIHRRCRERGMDFVTVTDHNTLAGSLAIADLPGVFLSAEMTTYFPEDRCKIHCLVFGVTEADFAELDATRENIYEFAGLLRRRGIAHAVAHPLFRINDRLTPDHVEKLLLLFNHFELLNGSRDRRAAQIARRVFDGLTPEWIARMADRHGLEPVGPEPWRKHLTGGSDDHSGLFVAAAHTATPPAADAVEFVAHLRFGRTEPRGRSGDSLRLARSLYQIAGDYYRSRFLGQGGGSSVLGAMLARLAEGSGESAPAASSGGLWRRGAGRIIQRVRRRRLPESERRLLDAISDLVGRGPAGDDTDLPPERRAFQRAARVAQELTLAFGTRLFEQFRRGRLTEALEALASLCPVGVGILPYLTAFVAQHKDERFLQEVALRFPGAATLRRRSARSVWITDTFHEINGVARSVRTLAGIAARCGRDVTVLVCQDRPPAADFPLRNFPPLRTFTLPEYPAQPLAFPPYLEILAWIEDQRFDRVVISTPGPLGLCGLAAARLFGLRCVGVYHTDFPEYVRLWTDDEQMKELTWRYMRWFYGDMDRVFVPSRAYLERLSEQGFRRERLAVMPRGIDRELFRPERRDPAFWSRYGIGGGLKFVYVGRLAREKNLALLGDAFLEVRRRVPSANLAFVGDGPDAPELRARFGREPGIVFTGPLHGVELARAYASSDALVFPSLTDTFGNVVLEAHACGLPAIVADRGGPPEIVRAYGSGLVVEGGNAAAWAAAMERLAEDRELAARLREMALRCAADSRWESALTIFDDEAAPEPALELAPA